MTENLGIFVNVTSGCPYLLLSDMLYSSDSQLGHSQDTHFLSLSKSRDSTKK